MDKPTGSTVSPQEALIYAMVTLSAVDRQMTDRELRKIGDVVNTLPIFGGFDTDRLVAVAEACATITREEDGLHAVLATIATSLPKKLHEPPPTCMSSRRSCAFSSCCATCSTSTR